MPLEMVTLIEDGMPNAVLGDAVYDGQGGEGRR